MDKVTGTSRQAGVIRVGWLPIISAMTLVLLTLNLLADGLFWVQTSDSRYLSAGVLFPVFYMLIRRLAPRQQQGANQTQLVAVRVE